VIGNADAELLKLLDGFAGDLGLAFQIRDDILDIEADSVALGKTAGKDAAQNKSTYPALLGMAGAKARLDELAEKIKAALGPLDARADGLRAIADFAIARVN
jgi:farnesyl diphosphate synthase